MKLQERYISKKCKFTAVNDCFISTNPGKFSWKFPPYKNPPENISDNFVKLRKFFFPMDVFDNKIPGTRSENFSNVTYNFTAVYK